MNTLQTSRRKRVLLSAAACAALLSVASCRATLGQSNLRDAPAAGAANQVPPQPVFVVIGGYGSCKGMAFNNRFKSPFDGRVWNYSSYFTELFAGTGPVEHGSLMVSKFFVNTYLARTYTNIWLGRYNDWERSTILACHSNDTDFDKQEFVWWNPTRAQPRTDVLRSSDRYGAMGFDWFFVKSPPNPRTWVDPYAGPGTRAYPTHGGNQGFARFVAAVKQLAADLNPNSPIRPVYVIGHSMGGYMTVRLAEQLSTGVDLMAVETIDPISPALCPATNLSIWSKAVDVVLRGVTGMVLRSLPRIPGCISGYPADLAEPSAQVRRILDATNTRLNLPSDRKSWYHYYQDGFPILHSGHNRWADMSVLKRYYVRPLINTPLLEHAGGVPRGETGIIREGTFCGHMAINADEEVWRWQPADGRTDSWIAYQIRADALLLLHPTGAFDRWKASHYMRPSETIAGLGLALNDAILADNPMEKPPVTKTSDTPLTCTTPDKVAPTLQEIVGDESMQQDFAGADASTKSLCIDGAGVESIDATTAVLEGNDGHVFAVHATEVDPDAIARSVDDDANVLTDFTPTAPATTPAG